MIYELRRYELNSERKKEFYQRFEKQFMPIAQKYGLKFVGAWDSENNGNPETIYVLAWEDLNTMHKSWDKVLADKDWVNIKKESLEKHGVLVLKTHSQIMTPTNYSKLK